MAPREHQGKFSRNLTTAISNIHKNIVLPPRERQGRFSCGCNNSALPTGQPASYELLGHAYYSHYRKSCMRHDNDMRVLEMQIERLRLEQAIQTGKRLLAETEFNTTADREAHKKELESKKKELRSLKARKEMAVKAIWSTFDGLWPELGTPIH